jgi:hypothetical protein
LTDYPEHQHEFSAELECQAIVDARAAMSAMSGWPNAVAGPVEKRVHINGTGQTRLKEISCLAIMSDVTLILQAIERGKKNSSEELIPLVYNELRRLAAVRLATEPAGQTLQPRLWFMRRGCV